MKPAREVLDALWRGNMPRLTWQPPQVVEVHDLIVDGYYAPRGWAAHAAALGIRPGRMEALPLAQGVRLVACRDVPDVLPKWLKRERR